MKTDTELCDYDIRQKKQKENLKIMGGVNMKKTATRLTDEEIWRKELDKIYSATTDKSPKELQMTVFIKSIMAQARAEGKKEGIAEMKDEHIKGYKEGVDYGMEDGKEQAIADFKARLINYSKGNVVYGTSMNAKQIIKEAIAEAEKGGKR